jgi:hypothetical protein
LVIREFTPEAVERLAQFTARQKARVRDAIEVQLKHEPIPISLR